MTTKLKHREAVYSIFSLMFKDGMTEEDKKDFIQEALKETGMTLTNIDDDLERGVQQGFPLEAQIERCRMLIQVIQHELN